MAIARKAPCQKYMLPSCTLLACAPTCAVIVPSFSRFQVKSTVLIASRRRVRGFALCLSFLLAGCGGGGSSPETPVAPPVTPPTVPTPPVTPPVAAPALMTFTGAPDIEPLAETVAITRTLQAVALINDPVRTQVIASVVQAGGYALVGLDPATLETLWTMPAPAYVSRFTLADDGATLYALMPDAKAVWQLDLRTRSATRVISTTDGSSPLDVAVRPGHPGTIVVTSGRTDIASPFGRAQAFDDGVPRPAWLGVGNGTAFYSAAINEVEFIDQDTLFSLDTETSQCSRQHVSLTPTGLLGTDMTGAHGECFDETLSSLAGQLFTRGGTEFSPQGLHRLRSFPGYGVGIPHPGLNSFLRISRDESVTAKSHRVRIDEYSMGTRQYMKRRLVATASTPLITTGVGAYDVIQDAVAVGASRIVVAVYDRFAVGTPQVMLMSIDIAAVAPLQPWNFSTRTASTGTINGWALRIPTDDVTYDAAMDRIIATVSLVAGPSGVSIAVIRPDTGAVERLIPLLSKPTKMRVSAQGSIAYVASTWTNTLQKIDLRTGAILATMPDFTAIELTVKPDDPHTFAAITIDKKQDRVLSSFTHLVQAPLLIDSRSDLSLDHAILLGANSAGGGNQLLVYQEKSPDSLWRLNWTSSGLSLSAPGKQTILGSGGGPPRMDFGRISSIFSVIDSVTDERRAAFTSSSDPFLLTAANAGVALFHDHINYAPALQWLTEPLVPNASLSWDKGQYLSVKDTAEESAPTFSTLHILVKSPPGRVALRKIGQGGYMGAFEQHFGYLYVVKKD